MWGIIFILVIAAAISGFIYLISRFARFKFIDKASKSRKSVKILLSIVIVILITGIIWLSMGYVNAIICMLHLAIFWLVFDLISSIIKKYRKKDFKLYYAGILTIAFTVIYLSAGWYFAHHVSPTHYIIETNKEVDSLRIVFFADSHIGATFNADGFSQHIKSIQNEKPDIVLITGDYIDDDTSKEDMIKCCELLGTLDTTYGVYFSFGNHDKGYYDEKYRGYNGDDLIYELTRNGVIVLQDESILIDDTFYVIGRQDFSETEKGSSRASMEDLMNGLDTDKFIIVMDHQPHDYTAQAAAKVDLVLSGHTHGGQFFPITYVGEWIGANDRTYGYEKRDNTSFIVTSGISDWAIKFKTGCKSEYVIIDIKTFDFPF